MGIGPGIAGRFIGESRRAIAHNRCLYASALTMVRMTNKHFLFQTPDERLASLNDWAARDYPNAKLVDGLAGDAEAQARKRAETLGLPPDSEARQAELDRARSALYRSRSTRTPARRLESGSCQPCRRCLRGWSGSFPGANPSFSRRSTTTVPVRKSSRTRPDPRATDGRWPASALSQRM